MQIINCSLIFTFADELFCSYVKGGSKPIKICVNLLMSNQNLKFKTEIFELTEENIDIYYKENKGRLYKI